MKKVNMRFWELAGKPKCLMIQNRFMERESHLHTVCVQWRPDDELCVFREGGEEAIDQMVVVHRWMNLLH